MSELSSHPSREELSAYSLGQLPEDRAVAIDDHVSECRPCCETIVGLSSEDTFAALLQEVGQLPSDPLPTDETFDDDVSLAKPAISLDDVPAPLTEHPRYEIVRLIGKGGMGDVYEARHRKMERRVALKVINRDLVRKPEAVERFRREMKTAGKLSHPNIVTAYDADQAGAFHFMVMEYVDGVDLSRIIKDRGPLPVAEACDYVRQAAIGLQHAHEQGMVHRDIKPHNLMVTADGTVKILDFGLASLAPEVLPDADTVEARGELTAAGAIVGTPDFISPEQAEDAHQADIRSDIYSLGTTLYFLLAGQPPFADGSVMHKLKSHAEAEPASLESLREDIPADLAAVVARMTAKDPEKRFQTPMDVAEALKPFSVAPQPAPKKRPSRKQVAPCRRRRRLWPLAAVATLFIAGIVAGVAYKFSATDGFFMIAGGAGCGGDGWYMTSGSTYLKQGEPCVLFGMVESPSGDRGFSYVVLIRHEIGDFPALSGAPGEGLAFDGEVASIKDGISIDGKAIELDLEVRVNKREIESTRMAVDGKAVNASLGRLFLVDFTSDRPTWSQVMVEFPSDLPAPVDLVGDTKLVSEVARRITEQLASGNDEVRAFLAGDALPADDNMREAGAQRTDSKFAPEIAEILAKSGQSEAEFRKKLYNSLSQAAGIPNAQWEKVATDPRASTEWIEGEPLSHVLLTVDPAKASEANPEVLEDFRYLTDGWPKPTELHKAMSASQPHGYVSLIQPEYIRSTKIDIDVEGKVIRGSVVFESPDLYAGKVNFAARYDAGQLRPVEFALPNYGITIAPDVQWVWHRKNAEHATRPKPATDLEQSVAAQIERIDKALDAYKVDTGSYPRNEEGLYVLIQRMGNEDRANAWAGPYLNDHLTDPWGVRFLYEFPGTRGGNGTRPNVWSLGPDRIDNTEDDIGNWE